VSRDLDTWTALNPCLLVNPEADYESAHVWAPYVFESPTGWLMFYAGCTAEPSQCLCMAESVDPELAVWRGTTKTCGGWSRISTASTCAFGSAS
jgi:hypothetical protein